MVLQRQRVQNSTQNCGFFRISFLFLERSAFDIYKANLSIKISWNGKCQCALICSVHYSQGNSNNKMNHQKIIKDLLSRINAFAVPLWNCNSAPCAHTQDISISMGPCTQKHTSTFTVPNWWFHFHINGTRKCFFPRIIFHPSPIIIISNGVDACSHCCSCTCSCHPSHAISPPQWNRESHSNAF